MYKKSIGSIQCVNKPRKCLTIIKVVITGILHHGIRHINYKMV